MNYYFDVLKKYAVFNGRARRKEYWMFFLVNIIIVFVLGLIAGLVGVAAVSYKSYTSLFAPLYSLAVFIPSIAVAVRRLHDTNRSGWWLLIGLVPIIGTITLLVFTVRDSQLGENQYGSNPKEIKVS